MARIKKQITQKERIILPALLLVGLALFPLFFLPYSIMSFGATKLSFVVLGVLLVAIVLLFGKLKDNECKIPLNRISLALVLVPLSYLLATLFAERSIVALFGNDFGYDNVFVIAIISSLIFLIAFIYEHPRWSIRVLIASAISLCIALIVAIVNFIFPDIFADIAFFTNQYINTLGKPHDIAIFAGLGLVMSTLVGTAFRLDRRVSISIFLGALCCTLALLVIHVATVWYVVALCVLSIFVYTLTVQKVYPRPDARFPWFSLIVFFIACVAIVAQGLIVSFTGSIVRNEYVEVIPNIQTTIEVAQQSLQDAPLLGYGPGNFNEAWNLYKPEVVVAGEYWNTPFSSGFSSLLTTLITTGLLGFLAWVFFLVSYIWVGLKGIMQREDDNHVAFYVTLISFVASLFLWTMFVVYVPGFVVLVYAGITTGVCIGSLYHRGILSYTLVDVARSPRKGFAYIVSIIVFVLVVIVLGNIYTRKVIADHYNQHAVLSFSEARLDDALAYSQRAYASFNNTVYLQNIADIEVARMQVDMNDSRLTDDEKSARITSSLTGAVGALRTAIQQDPDYHMYYILLARIYESIVSFGVDGAYEEARKSYKTSLEYSPHNPEVYTSLARLEVAQQNNVQAQEYIEQAREIKENYVDAYILLSHIHVLKGDTQGAVNTLQQALAVAPLNPFVHFNLGVLKYENKDMGGAVVSLENAVLINPTYVQAKYLLGRTYYALGRNQDAINQIEDVVVLTQKDEAIIAVLEAMKRGESIDTPSVDPVVEEGENIETTELISEDGE